MSNTIPANARHAPPEPVPETGLAEVRALQEALSAIESGMDESQLGSLHSELTVPGVPTPAETVQEPPPLERILEAMGFVEGRPISARRAAEIIPELTEEQFLQAITQLNRRYREQGRPYGFVLQGDGYLLTLRPQYRFLCEKLYGDSRETTLSLAAIEVLAIVAYKQPVSRSTIDALRGRNSSGVIRQLLRRGLIAAQYPEQAEPGRPASSGSESSTTLGGSSPTLSDGTSTLAEAAPTMTPAAPRRHRQEPHYVTTPRFLAVFGLRDLSDLPRTDDLEIL